jgi:hypothetical protein
MKRTTLTLLTTVLLPACAAEGLNNTSDAGPVTSNDNVRVTTGTDSNTAPATTTQPSGSSQATLTGTTSSVASTASDERSSSSAGTTSFGATTVVAATESDESTSGLLDPRTSMQDESSTADSVDFTTTDSTTTEEALTGDSEPDASSVTSDAPVESEFDIDLVFVEDSESSEAVVEAFERAEAFWEELIVGDLPDVTTRRQPCNGPDVYVEGDVDDLVIFVAVGPIDGRDGVLGAAGPCLGRPTMQGGLPLAGFMQFDVEDLERYAQQGRLDEVIIHEMGHVLGFGGVLWEQLGYLADPSDDNAARDTHFTGEKAIAEFDAIGGNAYNDAKVPVENIGGQGTANGHWREEVLGNEMMTSYMTNLEAVMSSVTLAALEDMGYQVDYSKAGGYEWPPPDERSQFFSLRTEEALPPIELVNDILDIPFITVD